ncbi:MAG: HNH endonuclease [Terracidiphilus sp.]
MGSTTLVDLLDLWGIDLRKAASSPVRVLRHGCDDDVPRRLYNLGIQYLECYQAAQKRRVFGDAKILVSFINTQGREAEFVGVYNVHGCERGSVDPPFAEKLPEDLLGKCRSNYHYILTRDPVFDHFKGCVRIEWDKMPNRWCRRNQDANMKVVAVKGASGQWQVPDGREALLDLGIVPTEGEPDSEESGSYKEGARRLKTHLSIERSGALVRESKAQFKKTHGRLRCQACRFDFLDVYGEDYIECHHTIPVHKLPSDGSTRPEDVVLLCSNCHRMIHRRKEWMSVDQLIALLAGRRSEVSPKSIS